MEEIGPPRALDAQDDRASFDCGRPALNAWFQRHAWQNQRAGVSRTNIVEDLNTGRIAGYVTLSAAQIRRGFLPRSQQRNTPDPVPATLLGQLAVDLAYQGRGHARSLLYFALKTALEASRHIGSFGVITHPLDDEVRAFYSRWGFVDLPGAPHPTMAVRFKDLERSGFV